jgi:hypothetical protein
VYREIDHLQNMTLIHRHESFEVSLQLLVDNCNLFKDNPALAASPYTPKSLVSLDDFRDFASALNGKAVTITNKNFRGLLQLCEEFRFHGLAAQLSQFRLSDDFNDAAAAEDSDTRMSLLALEEQMQRRDEAIALLRCELFRQSRAHESVLEELRRRPDPGLLAHITRLEAELSALRSHSETDLKKFDDFTAVLLKRVARLEAEVSVLRTAPEQVFAVEQLGLDVRTLKVEMGSLILSVLCGRQQEPFIVSE